MCKSNVLKKWITFVFLFVLISIPFFWLRNNESIFFNFNCFFLPVDRNSAFWISTLVIYIFGFVQD